MSDSKPELKTESTKTPYEPSLPATVLLMAAPLVAWVAIVTMVMNFAR